MFKFLKNDLLKILDVTQTERDTLFNHKIYSSIHDMNHLHIFMENHIFAVWDFMSILKTLQRDLTCTEIPWIPKNGGTPGRLLNEIVTEEETDIIYTIVSHWADFDKVNGRKTNPNSQQKFFSTDVGMEFSALTVQDIKWGRE